MVARGRGEGRGSNVEESAGYATKKQKVGIVGRVSVWRRWPAANPLLCSGLAAGKGSVVVPDARCRAGSGLPNSGPGLPNSERVHGVFCDLPLLACRREQQGKPVFVPSATKSVGAA